MNSEWRRIRVGVVAALLIAFVALGFAVGRGWLLSVDGQTAGWIVSPYVRPTSRLARILSGVGSAPVWDVLITLVAVACYIGRRRWQAATLGIALTTAEVTTIAAKTCLSGPGVVIQQLAHIHELDGFPSGHVVRVVVTVAALAAMALGPRLGFFARLAPGLVGGAVMGWARIATHSHSPSDVLGAFLLAGLILSILFPAIDCHFEKPKTIPRCPVSSRKVTTM